MLRLPSKRILWRLAWLLGIAPLLVTDFTIAATLSQLATSRRQVVQTNSNGDCSQIRSILESNPLNQAIAHIAECSPNDVLEAALEVLDNSSSGTDTKVAALYALYGLSERSEATIDARLTDLLIKINPLLSAEADQVETAAAVVAGVLTVRAVHNQNEDVNLTDTINSLLTLTSSDVTEVNARLAGLNALRDVGYAIQEQVRQELLQNQIAQETSSEMSERWQQKLNRYSTLTGDVADELLYQLYKSAVDNRANEIASPEVVDLIADVRVARVEALSAFLLIRSLANGNFTVEARNIIDRDIIDRDIIGVWALNYVSSDLEEASLVRATAIASLERLGYQEPFSQIVERQLCDIASDIDATNHLLENFTFDLEDGPTYRTTNDLLNALAVPIQNCDRSEVIAAIEPQQAQGYWENWRERRRQVRQQQQQREQQQNIQISAVEVMSRIAAQRASSNPSSLPTRTTVLPENTNSRPDNSASNSHARSRRLLYLLREGLSQRDERDDQSDYEIRQRAEIAFNQIYNRNLSQLSQAIANAGGHGNFAVQHTAVQALGAVNYRRIPRRESNAGNESLEQSTIAPEYLILMTRFLGQSLMCSGSEDVRRDAAYALGQLAPYWPELLHQPIEPYWHNLSPVESSDSFGEICRGGPLANAESLIQPQDPVHRISVSVLDALLLRLDDSSEAVIVRSSYALSRYGIALNSEQSRNELAQAIGQNSAFERDDSPPDESLQALRTCMKALVSPTRLDRWFDIETSLELHQPLIRLADGYREKCSETHFLFRRGSDNSAIAAAFILGQIGITDGQVAASLEERETIEYLLRVLNGRDKLAQEELNRLASRRERQADNEPDRADSVRDSIVSHALGQIHPREHELIRQLLDAITFPDTEQVTDGRARETRCALTRRDYNNSDVIPPVCLNHPTTRAAVVGAIEYIGIEDVSLQNYVRRLRQLLTQDVNPGIVQAALPSVVEQTATDATPPGRTTSNNSDAPLTLESFFRLEPGSPLFALVFRERSLTTQDHLAEARRILSVPYDSILSCAGATYALARIGVRDHWTVDQLMNYLYIYPQPLHSENGQATGNLCTSEEPEPDSSSSSIGSSEAIPSRVEQLILLKRGAIEALGQIDPNYQNNHPNYQNNHPNDPNYQNNDVAAVVHCLVRIANFEPFVPDQQGCPLREPLRDPDPNRATPLIPLIIDDEPELCPEISQDDEPALPTEETQARKWGLFTADCQPDASQFFRLKRELQEPAIEAIGQLARTEDNIHALCALAFEGSEGCGNRYARVGDYFKIPQSENNLEDSANTDNPFELRLDYRQQARTLKLRQLETTALYFTLRIRQLEAVALHSQPSSHLALNLQERQRLEQKLNVIRKWFVPHLSSGETECQNDGSNAAESRKLCSDAIEFRNDVLSVLAKLEREAFSDLFNNADGRKEIIERLGISRLPTGIARDCLFEENNPLRQELVCFGATRLLSSILRNPSDTREPVFASAIQFVRDLAQPSRYNPIIRASAIEALSKISRYSASNEILFSNLEVSELTDGDDSRIVEQEHRVAQSVVIAFAQYAPSEVIPSLSRWLQEEEEDVQKAAYLIRQLGRIAVAPEEYGVTANPAWSQEALASSSLVLDLVRILETRSIENVSLRAEMIDALGELRSNNRQATEFLRRTLDSSPDLSLRVSATYALGKIGETHPGVARSVIPSLYDIAVSEDESSDELRVTAAYAIAQMGIQDNRLPANINRHAIVNSLIAIYNDAIPPDSVSVEIDPDAEAVGAIALYAIGELGSGDDHLADLFADGLQPNRPTNIRVIAATYVRNLSLWNQDLTNALIDAVEDSNVAIRYNAIISLGQSPNFDFNNSGIGSQEKIITALSEIFWNERNPQVRLAAGRVIYTLRQTERSNEDGEVIYALHRIDLSNDEEFCRRSTPTEHPQFSCTFIDILAALQEQERLSIGFQLLEGDRIPIQRVVDEVIERFSRRRTL